MTQTLQSACIVGIQLEGKDVLSFELQPADGTRFPPVDPGAHVDVHLPNGLVRSYSLSNGRDGAGSYRLTVAIDAKSRGGSRYMHEALRVGQVIDISAPRNNFALAEDAPSSLFIAGGIGVTPFVSMIARLNALGRSWRLHYCVRTRARAALLQEIEALAALGHGTVLTNFDEEPGGKMLDLAAVLSGAPDGAHLYCCGPIGMLDAFKQSAEANGIAPDRVHVEYFSNDAERATEGGFVVELARSGREVMVQPGQSILEALKGIGVDVAFSCEEGVCGSCETAVISGVPDHRDRILSDREREQGRTMMICCSGAKSSRLVLDL